MSRRYTNRSISRLVSGRLGAAALILLLLPTGALAQDSGAAPSDLPQVDLAALEPAVAEQISILQEHTASVLAGETTAGERGEAIGELGRLFHAYELLEHAEHCYLMAAALAPQDFRWRYHLGYLYQNVGRLEEAAAEYERALGIFAQVPPALVRLGQVYLALNQTEAAEDVVRRALELSPLSASALAVLGEVRVAQGRHREAIEALEAALDQVPGANRLFYPLALAYRELGDEDRARELIAKRGTVGVRPADPLIDGLADLTTGERVHMLRGHAAFGAGRYAEAAEEFAAAVAADPESVPARVNLGSALAETGRSDEGIEQYRAAIELAPGNVTARYNLGSLLARQGRLEEAVGELRQAVQYGPRDPGAHYKLAVAMRRSGKLEDSLTHYALAIELGPPAVEARVGRAGALEELGRHAEARAVLEESLALVPSSGLLATSLARLLVSSPDGSVRDGERALELANMVYGSLPIPRHAELIAEALAESGRCEEAAELQEGLIEKVRPQATASTLDRHQRTLERFRAGPVCRLPVLAPDDAPSP